jgi:hypothetical protein
MLGFVSRFGAAKGMVAVPNFVGLSNATANSQLTSAGLIRNSLSAEIPTNNSGQNEIILNQLPAAGTLVDYETLITINRGKFVADTITVSPCQAYTTPTNDPDYCSGTVYVYGSTRTKNRKTVTTTNNVTGVVSTSYEYSCADTVLDRGSAYVDGQCGHVVPPATCTYTNTITETACNAAYSVGSSGTFTRTSSGTNTDCNPYSSSESVRCWQAVCGSYGSWTINPINSKQERRTRTCQRTDGTTYPDTQTRCRITYSTTYGTCRNLRKLETTVATDLCTGIKTTTTASIPCNIL